MQSSQYGMDRKWAEKTKMRGRRDLGVEEWMRDTDSSSTEGYTAPHAGTVGLRNRLPI